MPLLIMIFNNNKIIKFRFSFYENNKEIYLASLNFSGTSYESERYGNILKFEIITHVKILINIKIIFRLSWNFDILMT